jgi:hypothetical protein
MQRYRVFLYAKSWDVVPKQKVERSVEAILGSKWYHYVPAAEMMGGDGVASNSTLRQENAIRQSRQTPPPTSDKNILVLLSQITDHFRVSFLGEYQISWGIGFTYIQIYFTTVA